MKKAFAVFLILLLIILLIPFAPVEREDKRPKTRVIFITHNPIHTGFLFPYSEDWNDFPKANYLEFSWGDRDFFVNVPTWDKFTLSVGLDAMFTPEPGLMHVDLFDKINVPYKQVQISEEQYQIIKRFILESFAWKEGAPVRYPHSYYDSDSFYLSTENYHLFNTCNNWTRKGLAKAGIRTSLWTYHKWGVLYHLD